MICTDILTEKRVRQYLEWLAFDGTNLRELINILKDHFELTIDPTSTTLPSVNISLVSGETKTLNEADCILYILYNEYASPFEIFDGTTHKIKLDDTIKKALNDPYTYMRKKFVRNYCPELSFEHYTGMDNISDQCDFIDSMFTVSEKKLMDDNSFFISGSSSLNNYYSDYFCRKLYEEATVFKTSASLRNASDILNGAKDSSANVEKYGESPSIIFERILKKIYSSTIH